MQRYKNLDGNSGVLAYEIEEDFIKVKFSNGDVYLYTVASTGRTNIEAMKSLAVAGRGLSTFISRYVREGYASKVH